MSSNRSERVARSEVGESDAGECDVGEVEGLSSEKDIGEENEREIETRDQLFHGCNKIREQRWNFVAKERSASEEAMSLSWSPRLSRRERLKEQKNNNPVQYQQTHTTSAV